MGHWAKNTIALLALLAVFACTQDATTPGLSPTSSRNKPYEYTPSPRSMEYRAYFTNLERSLRSQGMLRTDAGGPDTPFSKSDLVENFIRIGVYNEFTYAQGRFINQPSESTIQRWEKPVTVSLEFGTSVSPDQRLRDRKTVSDYVRRLSRITDTRIDMVRSLGNFHVAILDVDEIAAYGPKLQQIVPGLDASVAAQIINMPRPVYCAVFRFSNPDTPDSLDMAVAIIRSEHPQLLRQSCFHEEIAQGLGLNNDSPYARPSIFNDNDEFAFLTGHDELLLKILYDERLPLGATPNQARPMVEAIASELLGGES